MKLKHYLKVRVQQATNDLPLHVTLCIIETMKRLYIRRAPIRPTNEKGQKRKPQQQPRLLKTWEGLLQYQRPVPTFNLHSYLPSASPYNGVAFLPKGHTYFYNPSR